MKRPPLQINAEWRAARNAALSRPDLYDGHDETDPTTPCGHEYGLRTSSRLTTDYRNTHRQLSMDVKPQEVVECLNSAKIKDWCLMGLHGYVGYLPMPRATQDVDVMIPLNQKQKAIKAIMTRWPELKKKEYPPVVRFFDPQEIDINGNQVPVIDLMLPFSPFQEEILRTHVIVDETTKCRYPTAEAAIVSKYAALISPHRNKEKLDYDAGDLRNLIRTAHPDCNLPQIQALAALVWEKGDQEIQEFINCALNEKPFPI